MKQFENGVQAQEIVIEDAAGAEVVPVDNTELVAALATVITALAGASPKTLADVVTAVNKMTAYGAIGAHSAGADISSATTLTKPANANSIILQALTKNVRWTLDGTTPTATVGFQLLADSSPVIVAVPGASIKVIQEAATANLQYQWVS
jgi:uncharacterized membrane protein